MGAVFHPRGGYADLGNGKFAHELAFEVELETETALDQAAGTYRSE